MIRAVAVAIGLLWSSAVAAQTVQNKEHRFELELPAGFSEQSETPEGTIASYRDERRGMKLSIVRLDYPNTPAWRRNKEFFESVETGVKDATRRYKRLNRKQHKLGRVPALDLWFSREHDSGHDVVAVRFVFFRTYTVLMSVAMTDEAYKEHRSVAKKLVAGFTTYFGK